MAYTAEAAGSRQLFTMPLRGGYATQLTASEKPISDPQWSPDGRRLAFVRDDEIWVIESDGSRLTKVTGHKAGTQRAALVARREAARIRLASTRLVAGVGHRRPGAAAGTARE